MKTLVALLVILHATAAWGSGSGQELTERLETLLKDGSTGEKILALSMLPKPGCRDREAASGEDLFIRAMKDPDPLVREMALVTVRRSFGSANQNPPTQVADPGHPDDLSPLPEDHSVKRMKRGGRSSLSPCGSQKLFEALKNAASDAEPRVRMEAAVSLGITGRTEAAPTLSRLTSDTDPFVRTGAAFALGILRSREGIAPLSSLIVRTTGDWRDFFARREGLKALQRIWVSEWMRGVRRTRSWGPGGVGETVTEERFDPAVRSAVLSVAMKVSADPAVRKEAFSLIAEIRAPEAVDLLRAGAGDGDPVVRVYALRGLTRIAGQKDACNGCYTLFATAATDADPRVRRAAMRGLGEYVGEDVLEVILKGLKDPDGEVRKAAVAAFRAPYPKALDALSDVMAEKGEMRSIALRSLRYLTREKGLERTMRPPSSASTAMLRQGKKVIVLNGSATNQCSQRFHPREPKVRIRNGRVVDRIIALFDSFSVEERVYALEILQRFDDVRITPFLARLMKGDEEQITVKAMEIAARYSMKDAFPAIARNVGSGDARVRSMVREIFPCMRESVPIAEAKWMATDPDAEIRKLFFETFSGPADPDLADTCLRGLRDPSEGVRAAAARCFVENPDSRAVPILTGMLSSSGQEAAAAAQALAFQNDARATSALLDALTRKNRAANTAELDRTRDVLMALGPREETEGITPVVLRLLKEDPEGPLAPDLLKTLGFLRDSRAVPALLDYVREKRTYDVDALYALAGIRDPAALDELKRVIADPKGPQRRRAVAVYALIMIPCERGTEMVLDVIERHGELRPEVARYTWITTDSARRMVAAAAGRAPTAYRDYFNLINAVQRSWLTVKFSGKLLRDPDPDVVRGAVLMLGASKDPDAVAELRGVQDAGNPVMQGLVNEAINAISGKGTPGK